VIVIKHVEQQIHIIRSKTLPGY